MQPIYRYFAGEGDKLDFSEQAEIDAYLWETKGIGNFKVGLFSTEIINGYVLGKHWMDATVMMWIKDLKCGLLRPKDLYLDPELKDFHWWIDKIIKRRDKIKGY